ncbi:MAG TPA: hypothetical protein VNZ47_08255, partial [Candidatus Dormibacteraeota bacterium]|nr:hypothetical protein [Candidatus Dormibacteraeota bacterium]
MAFDIFSPVAGRDETVHLAEETMKLWRARPTSAAEPETSGLSMIARNDYAQAVWSESDMKRRVAVVPGDGIGKEVIPA